MVLLLQGANEMCISCDFILFDAIALQHPDAALTLWDEAWTASSQFKTSRSAVAGGMLSTEANSRQLVENLTSCQQRCQVCMLLRPQGAWEACRTANDLGHVLARGSPGFSNHWWIRLRGHVQ